MQRDLWGEMQRGFGRIEAGLASVQANVNQRQDDTRRELLFHIVKLYDNQETVMEKLQLKEPKQPRKKSGQWIRFVPWDRLLYRGLLFAGTVGWLGPLAAKVLRTGHF